MEKAGFLGKGMKDKEPDIRTGEYRGTILCLRCGRRIPKSRRFIHEWKHCPNPFRKMYPEAYDRLRLLGKL